MKSITLAAALFFVPLLSANAQSDTLNLRNAGVDYPAPEPHPWKFGMGVQVASSPLFLFSWQSPDKNPYGRAWRIEPLIGFTYNNSEGSANNTSTSESLTLGLGYSLRWRVRYPFNNLYFSFGPRAIVTGYKTTSDYSYPDTQYSQKSQYLSTTLSIMAGPEYAIDGREAHFTIAGFASIGATIRGRTKYDYSTSYAPSWNLSIATGTGIVLRYYFG